MQFSSVSEANIEFQKCFYKQLFFDLYNECNQNGLIERFYKFQVDLFETYIENLEVQKYFKVFTFHVLNNQQKMQLLESVFYHLIGTLKTLPIKYINEDIDISEHLNQHDMELIQNGIIGPRPRAIDFFSPEFLLNSHKEYCQSEYLDFLLFNIRNRLLHVTKIDYRSLILSSLKELLETYPIENQEINICPNRINLNIDLKQIVHHSQLTELYLSLLEEGNNTEDQCYFIKNWGIEAGITSIFKNVTSKLNIEPSINVNKEIFTYFSNLSERNLSSFIDKLINSDQIIRVYVPVSIPRAEKWEIPQEFQLKFISYQDFTSIESGVPSEIATELEREASRFSHIMSFQKTHINADYLYMLNEVNGNWNDFLDLLHLHEKYPIAYKAFFNLAFINRTNKVRNLDSWRKVGYSAKYRPLLDDFDYKKKLEYFNKVDILLLNSNSELAKKIIASYNLYRESLELSTINSNFAFGSMWLCLEMISGCFKPKEVAKRLAFIPALLTDDIYNKDYFNNLTDEDIKNLYERRKSIFETIIEELGELRNKLIFHRTDPHMFQSWRLERHHRLLEIIVRQVQVVTANSIVNSPGIKKIQELKELKESQIIPSRK
ncbi:hypothetical protein V7127_20525 [Bacillus sp. JJ1773]|uniref:hypothetical protein n=1 Tax=Bacillus sp. JJ1773 TaxID=3122965 RepID=UPI002FFEB10C